MQHGVIVFVLRAPEVLHAQTLGGNMLSRDSLVFSVIRLQVPFDKSEALVHSWCSPDSSYDRDPSTNILLLRMLFRTSSSVTAVIARHSEPQ